MTARRLLAAVSAGAAVLALSACERPAPIVTVVSGTNSEWKEADVYCFEGQSLGDSDCAERSTESVAVPVEPGQRVGVDVSKDVAERGWFIELSAPDGQGEAQSSDIQVDRHYFSFTAPNVGPEGLRLTVKALDEDDPRGSHTGEWTFDLVPR
jgi:hypothetical protein